MQRTERSARDRKAPPIPQDRPLYADGATRSVNLGRVQFFRINCALGIFWIIFIFSSTFAQNVADLFFFAEVSVTQFRDLLKLVFLNHFATACGWDTARLVPRLEFLAIAQHGGRMRLLVLPLELTLLNRVDKPKGYRFFGNCLEVPNMLWSDVAFCRVEYPPPPSAMLPGSFVPFIRKIW